MPTGKSLKYDDYTKIANYYLSKPMTIGYCAEHFGLCIPSIIKALNINGIERHKKAVVYNPMLNEHYFESIDSEPKAYYLGLLLTDGNIFIKKDKSNRQASISITQKESDNYILKRFLEEVGSKNMIGNDGRGASTVAIRSDIMASDLEKYGIVPTKSLCSYLPTGIDKSLMSHLFRGIVDGDGSIQSYYCKDGHHRHSISLCGTHLLMEQMSDYLHKELGVRQHNIYDYKDKCLSEFKIQSINEMYIVGNWLYDHANVYLHRKRKKFENFLEYYNNKHGNTEVTSILTN